MPWRNIQNPYYTWVSEIILQQTRVEQGWPYFEKFISKFPTVYDLAGASEEDLLSVWQGLGYYSRALNLQKSAGLVTQKYGGKIPDTWQNIIELPGVGPYTAAAVLSIAYNKPYPAIDGNVQRVISRYLNINLPVETKQCYNQIWQFLEEEISHNDPASFNQGLMEIGSLICKPQNPACDQCPLQDQCLANQLKNWAHFPVKKSKTKVKTVFHNYLYINQNKKILCYKRNKNSIWKGLWELPVLESNAQLEHLPAFDEYGIDPSQLVVKQVINLTHQLSHRKIVARFWHCSLINEKKFNPKNCDFMPNSQFVNKGITQLTKKFISMPLVCIN